MDAQGPVATPGAAAPWSPQPRSRRRRLATALVSLLAGASLVHASVPILSARTLDGRIAQPGPAVVVAPLAVADVVAADLPSRLADPSRLTGELAEPDPIKLGPPATRVYHVRTDQKVIALTFDDGWNVGAGRLILDTLVRLHVPATFFVNAMYVRRSPQLWKDIAAAGFPIGNHTYDHRDLTTLSYDQMLADLRKDARVFHELTGYTMAPIFRPPYGARNPTVDAAALAAGYPTEVLWNTVAGDTATVTTDRREIANATAGGPGSIVLLHVGPSSTPRILAAVIASYRARGFTFVTIPELLSLRS